MERNNISTFVGGLLIAGVMLLGMLGGSWLIRNFSDEACHQDTATFDRYAAAMVACKRNDACVLTLDDYKKLEYWRERAETVCKRGKS